MRSGAMRTRCRVTSSLSCSSLPPLSARPCRCRSGGRSRGSRRSPPRPRDERDQRGPDRRQCGLSHRRPWQQHHDPRSSRGRHRAGFSALPLRRYAEYLRAVDVAVPPAVPAPRSDMASSMVVQHVRVARSALLDLAAARWLAVPRRHRGHRTHSWMGTRTCDWRSTTDRCSSTRIAPRCLACGSCMRP